ncbi:uncharacterized protein LOC127836575 isoform X2 [Dreissena polymorpha]|nr:uncharacterized protein LOC127836575 isoform X2 [Dreissena polymorpha]
MEATTAANTSAHITVHGRSTEAFKAIWTYYQTGRLHIPLCVCSGAFKEELDYWGISTSELADCCLYRYYAFKEDQKTRGDFLKESSASPRNAAKKESCYPRLRTVTGRIWNIVDNADGSLASRFYFGLVIAMVLLSIITMALSTDPSLRRKASSCEILEYMDYTDNKDTDKYREHLGNPSCKSYLIFLPFMAYSAQNEEKQEAGYDGTNGKFGVKPGTTDPVFNIPTTPSKDATESIPFESIAPTVDKPSTSDHPVNTQESQTPIFSPTRRTDVIPCFSSLCPTKLPYRTKVIPQFISGEDEIVMSDGTTVRVPNLTVPVMALDVLESIALLFFSCDLLLQPYHVSISDTFLFLCEQYRGRNRTGL